MRPDLKYRVTAKGPLPANLGEKIVQAHFQAMLSRPRPAAGASRAEGALYPVSYDIGSETKGEVDLK
jgi:hypothetical protein